MSSATLFARVVAGAAVAAVLAAGFVVTEGGEAHAVESVDGSRIYEPQTFYVYVAEDETLDVTFTQVVATSQPVQITAVDPTGAVVLDCTQPGGSANGVACTSTGMSSSVSGVWTIDYNPTGLVSRYYFDIDVLASDDSVETGRLWTTRHGQYQSTTSTQSYWIATREGYLYGIEFINYNGVGSVLRSNGFGLVEAGTCTPLYRSVEGTAIGANGVFLDPSVEYSESCGADYLLFFEEPDIDLPAAAPSASGEMWIRPAVVPASATNLQFVQDGPLSRVGDIEFDLAGVNGGFTVQIDTNANGVYTDAVDRIIPWGSAPGPVTVPFDGLDGEGEPIGACQLMNAKVVVDRAGETHFVLEDVEQLGNGAATQAGVRLTGLTPGIVAPAPLLYWDDRGLAARQPTEPYGGLDGTAGVDTTLIPATTGAHGWRYAWGDMRSIENWTYYEANAGAEVAIEPPCNPAMTIDKVAELVDENDNDLADAGEFVDYSFVVTNTGNAPLTDVSVIDPRVTGITPASADIPVGDEVTFVADPYEVTQEDVDSGSLENTAFAEGTEPGGEPIETPPDSAIVLTPERDPALTIDKVAELNDEIVDDNLAQRDETIDYTFLVTNTGNVTLTDVTVTDPLVTNIAPAPVTLAPGASQLFTADPYTVDQDDLNTGSITNTAFATGTSPTGEVESPTDSTTTPTPEPVTLLELEKSGELLIDADSDGQITPDDTIEYTFEVTNSGTVDLSDVSIVDARLAGPTTPATASIGAGESETFTAEYIVQQGDLDVGIIINTATATGIYDGPDGEVDVTSPPDTVELPTAPRAPDLELEKIAMLNDTNDNGFADVDETIDYSFLVTNTGNTTLVNLTVIDEMVTGLAPLSGPLLPTESATLSADPYVVTQDDVDNGGVMNVAVARGNIPGGPETTSPPSEEFVEGAPFAPGLDIIKTAELNDTNDNGFADAGETIVYSFRIENTGNVTLFDVAVDDPMLGDLVPAPIEVLSPTIAVIVSAEPYTVTIEDVLAGDIVNVATASGFLVDGETVVDSDEDTAILPVVKAPADSALASTGLDITTLAGVGALALLLGLATLALLATRTRRSAAH